MHIALLGGSFNPFHKAHLSLALSALNFGEIKQVQLLPAKKPWQKPSQMLEAAHRIAMIRLSIAGHPNICINTSELERDGLTYTIDTVEALPPEHKYYWIMGSDQLQNFTTWHRWQDILRHVDLLVAHRPSYPLEIPSEISEELKKLNKEIHFLQMEDQNLSSTQIREKIKNSQSIERLVHPEVIKYINTHNLYKE